MPMTEKDFKIERIQDGSFRVTRTDIDGRLSYTYVVKTIGKNSYS